MSLSPATPSYSQLVTSDEWRQEATEWIEDTVARLGYRVRGPLTQPRVRPWSTQLLVPTDHGTVWFKAPCAPMRFEPALQRLLSQLLPGLVAEPLAVDVERGWMLTADHGPPLAEDAAAARDDLRELVRATALAQRDLVAHREALLATGLPDCAPATVPERFDRLLDALASLPSQSPSHLEAWEADRFRARRSELVDACATMEAVPFPATFHHGDLHLKNAYRSGEGIGLFDFGDAQWAAAVEVLAVPYAIVSRDRAVLSWSDLVTAYLAAWDLDHTSFGVAWNASQFTHAVNRAFTWWQCLQSASEEEWQRWGEAPLAHLREMMRL
ncbi:phosphotransferase [uncultured Aeromicrobium sp.]|uniref:phosphotransferase n=1 Tax=uncultured Aeromicrobium sp. TaxID=337820 RepID=UPI0025FC7EA3|nr:phosphotransferase [uncultured Aeromicrobium sp.]